MDYQLDERTTSVCTDELRLAALRQYDILDTPPENEFDDLTRMISHICHTPIAVINFIDRDRQFFKSEIGLGVRELPLSASICARALLEHDLMVIPDTTLDARFADNPLVRGQPHLRFYAGAPLKTSDGTPLGTICVLDYEARHLTEEQFDALRTLARVAMTHLELRRALRVQFRLASETELAKLALESSLAAKDQFLAELSHELRTPLNPILITASSLEVDPRLPESLLEEIRIIRRSAEFEGRLIDDLLDITRINRDKVELRREVVAVRAQIKQGVQMLAADLAAKHLTLKLDVDHVMPGGLPGTRHHVLADPARLQQIVTNLLRNAIKFTPDGGTITVGVRDGLEDRIDITVTDSGIGVEPSRLGQVFNAYEQGDRSVTRRFGGLGLGLAICKALVERHGGSIACFSEGSGKGTTFTVSLPAVASPAVPTATPLADRLANASTADSDPSIPLKSRRILLVEDNEATARVMSRLLRHMSHEVATVGNMTAALHTADHRPFDLLISDVGLPDGSGLDLMRELKKRHNISGIAVTGYGMEDDVRKCHEAGFLLHLTKPISADQLRVAIDGIG